MNKIVVVLEQREGKLKRSAFEAVSFSASLASKIEAECSTIVIGSEVQNLDEIAKYGISSITLFKNDSLMNYSSSAYTDLVVEYVKQNANNIIIFSNTAFGKDLAPRVAARLDAGLLMDCISLEVNDNELVASRPVFAGKAILDAKLKSEIKVFTIRPNVFKPILIEDATAASVNVQNVEQPNLKSKVIEIKKSEAKLDVAEADIIVSGGRGIKGPENYHLIEELAEAVGGAVGASRAVVDAGWRPHREQVGQTGKTVSPSLYIACGISGAIQHLAGMSSSKYIVAINKDKDAPIFTVADYGIAGDLFEVLPKLTEEIKKLKSQ
ncbi:MAG: electron transfer flavoprotein subunit alpha/FixB family protein [Ignavibacteriaceae bacterium]|nr:electron transfer flavoprotein subunit alpha/FixB family protein [Ignavibacteriaceae bacterium]